MNLAPGISLGEGTEIIQEIVNEMRLIIVAAFERNLRPLDILFPVNAPQHMLEAAHATKDFRRQPDLAAKQLYESPRAQSNPVSHSGYSRSVRRLAELLESVSNGRM